MDIRKSSYKKLSKLLSTFEKKVQLLIHAQACAFHGGNAGV